MTDIDLSDDEPHFDWPDPNDTVRLELPHWMVKQLRGTAQHQKHTARTAYDKEDWQKIEALLDHALTLHEQDQCDD